MFVTPPNILKKIFLKQSRRDNTREALITPHKRSAVWGISNKRSAVWGMKQTVHSDCGHSETGMRSAVWGMMLLLLVTSASAQTLKKATPEQAKKMVETVNKATAAVKSIQCDFTQVRQSAMLKDKVTSKGKMSFSGKNLKWEYTEPNKFALVVKEENGQQQVYIQQDGKTRKADAQSGQLFKGIAQIVMGSVTGSALSDNGDFTVEMYTQGDKWVAKLTPKQAKLKKMFSSIYLYFNEKHNVVTKVEMKEANGDTTTITFGNVKLNG